MKNISWQITRKTFKNCIKDAQITRERYEKSQGNDK
jgi:hypothetical protein